MLLILVSWRGSLAAMFDNNNISNEASRPTRKGLSALTGAGGFSQEAMGKPLQRFSEIQMLRNN